MGHFVIENGRIELTEPFPSDMTIEQALYLAIEKWTLIAEYHKEHPNAEALDNVSSTTCALCIFMCSYCPIGRVSRTGNCDDTPWDKYFDGYTTAAAEERDFIIGIKDKLASK